MADLICREIEADEEGSDCYSEDLIEGGQCKASISGYVYQDLLEDKHSTK